MVKRTIQECITFLKNTPREARWKILSVLQGHFSRSNCRQVLNVQDGNIYRGLPDLLQDEHYHTTAKKLIKQPVSMTTPIVMKCFKRIILSHIQTIVLDTLEPLQFTNRPNRSTGDAISTIHTAYKHIGTAMFDCCLLTIVLVFNMVIPSKLISKLSTLGVPPTICNWVLNFLTSRPQSDRMGYHTSRTITIKTGIL